MTQKVKCRSISADEVTSVYVYKYILCIYVCVYIYVSLYIYIHIYTYIYINDKWWVIVQLKIVLRCDTTGFMCFCFQVKNLKSKNTSMYIYMIYDI